MSKTFAAIMSVFVFYAGMVAGHFSEQEAAAERALNGPPTIVEHRVELTCGPTTAMPAPAAEARPRLTPYRTDRMNPA